KVTRISADRLKYLHPAMDGEFDCDVQVRAHGSVVSCHAEVDRDADTMILTLNEPLSGVAPGQAAVLYFPSQMNWAISSLAPALLLRLPKTYIDDRLWIGAGSRY